jgi:hypothetical protein
MSRKEKKLWEMALFEAWWDEPNPDLLECYFHLASGGKFTAFPAFGLRVSSLQGASNVAHLLA